MATIKKKAAKPVPKKAPAKAVKKKTIKAKAVIKTLKSKPTAKKLKPKAAASRKGLIKPRQPKGPPVKKLAPKGKPAVKKPIVKPAAPKVAAAKPKTPGKTKPQKDPTTDYRNLRKYTHLKLTEIAENVSGIRAAIGSEGGDAPLAAWELLDFLKEQENVIPEWKAKKLPPPDGKPRKRGRPSKKDIEAKAGQVKPLASKAAAKSALDKVKKMGKPAAQPAAAPVVKPAIKLGLANGAGRPVIKLVRQPAPAN